jgi:hypothetical protein
LFGETKRPERPSTKESRMLMIVTIGHSSQNHGCVFK